MSGQIRKEDIIQQQEIQDAFTAVAESMMPFINNIKNATTEAQKLNKALVGTQGFKNLINLSKDVDKNNKNTVKSLHEITDAQRDFNKIIIETGTIYARNKNAEAGRTRRLEEEKVKKQELTKAIREEITGTKALAEVKKKEAAQSKQLTGQMIEYVNSIGKTNNGLKQLNNYYRELERESNKAANAQKKLNTEYEKNKARTNAAQTKQLNGALKEHVQALTATNPELKKMGNYYRKLERESDRALKAEQKQAAQAQKTANAKKGLSGVFGNLIRSIGVYAAAMFGLTRVIQFFTRDLLGLTTRLDSLDFSMKTVIKTQEEYAQTQLFLAETAMNYGQDILVLTERYVKFRAATQQSNMSVKATQKIFDAAAKSAGVLGLKTDEVNGVFLALEQMVSKGKVTTEELRRQLGERLPGAFGIMADAMGVSIRELDRMLKAGEVLSSEALPKFAEALEKAYGIEAVEKIDTLAAAQGRLKTLWVLFVKEIGASRPYIKIINEMGDALNSLKASMGLGNEYDFYINKQDRFGESLRNLKEEMDDYDLEKIINEQEKWRKKIDDVGFYAKQSQRFIDEYIDRRKLMEKESSSVNLEIFDFETEKKKIDSAKKEFENFGKIQEEGFREIFLSEAVFMQDSNDNYKEYIGRQIGLYNEKLKAADEAAKLEEEISRRTLSELENLRLQYGDGEEEWQKAALKAALLRHQEQQKIEEAAASNYAGLLEYRTLLETEYYEKSENLGNDSLKIMRERHKKELEETRKHQNDLILQNKYTEDELLRVRFDNDKELLQQERAQLQEQLEAVKGNALEEEKIRANIAKVDAEIAKDMVDWRIDEEKRRQRELERLAREEEQAAKERSRELYNILYDSLTAEQTEAIRAAGKDIEINKRKAKKILEIENQLAIDMIDIEIKRINEALANNEIIEADRERLNQRLIDLDKVRAQKENEIIKRSYQAQKEEAEKTISAIGEITGRAFDIIGNIYDAQLTRIDQLYKYEIAAAGDSVEKRIMAERKYEKERAKILRKQAQAEKAQAAFSIIINTAQAIMQTLGETGFFGTPLAVIIGALGAAQLATVLAQPIPEFAKGTDEAPETFIAGEKGQEAILKPSGDVVLTPGKPTLFSDKSFVGSTILPHDETQRMLANYAVSQSYDVIDMSESNNYLKKIAKNTKGSKEIFTRNGVTYMKRRNVTSKLL